MLKGKRIRVVNLRGWDNLEYDMSEYLGQTGTVLRDWGTLFSGDARFVLAVTWDDPRLESHDLHEGRVCLRYDNVEVIEPISPDEFFEKVLNME